MPSYSNRHKIVLILNHKVHEKDDAEFGDAANLKTMVEQVKLSD